MNRGHHDFQSCALPTELSRRGRAMRSELEADCSAQPPRRQNEIACLRRKRLFVLRHAKSSWDDPGLDDRERPLAPRGQRACKVMAEHLRTNAIEPELVLCSTSRRTRETLEGVAPRGENADRVRALLGHRRRSGRAPSPSARRRRLGDGDRPQPGDADARAAARCDASPAGGRHTRRDRAEVPDRRARDADVRMRLERARARASCSYVRPRRSPASPESRQRRPSTAKAAAGAEAPGRRALDSGSLRLPHFGDCTHEGQPDLHGHSPISRCASPTSRSNSS